MKTPKWIKRIDDAWESYENGEPDEAFAILEEVAELGDDAAAEAKLALGDMLLEAADAEGALDAYESIDGGDGEPVVLSARAEAHLDLCQLGPARELADRATRIDDQHAPAHFVLALIDELEGKPEAEKRFARARKLDPKAFPKPPRLSREEFDAIAAEAVDTLPEPVRKALENVPVLVDDLPPVDVLGEEQPPHSPVATMGLYVGTPIGEQSFEGTPATSRVLLFQRNIERACRNKKEIREQIAVTLLHEVGHHMGLDEDEVDELGLG